MLKIFVRKFWKKVQKFGLPLGQVRLETLRKKSMKLQKKNIVKIIF